MSSSTKLERAIERANDLRPRTKQLYLQHVRAFSTFSAAQLDQWQDAAKLKTIYKQLSAVWKIAMRDVATHFTLVVSSLRDVLIPSSDTTSRSLSSRENVVATLLVEAWCRDMQRREISPQSINVAIGALRTATNKASYTFADTIAALEVTAPRPEDITERALSWPEGKRLIGACLLDTRAKDLRDHAIVVLGLRTGMLRFSMCQMRLEDLKLTESEPSLTFTKKGGELHTILLDQDTINALQPWVDWLALHDITTGFVFRSVGRERVQHDFVSSGASVTVGSKLTPDGLYRALKARAVLASLPELSPHVFRCTFVAWAQKAKASEDQIAAVIGGKLDAPLDTVLPANFLIRSFS